MVPVLVLVLIVQTHLLLFGFDAGLLLFYGTNAIVNICLLLAEDEDDYGHRNYTYYWSKGGGNGGFF